MQFKNIRIGTRLGIMFGSVALLTLTMGFTAYRTLDGTSQRWDLFRTVSLEKAANVMRGELALGDAIHHFKNYILRGRDYEKKFGADMAAMDLAVTDYEKIGAISDKSLVS